MNRHERLRHNLRLWDENRIARVPDDGGAYWSTYRVTVEPHLLVQVPDQDLIDACDRQINLTGGKVDRDATGATVTVWGSE